MRILVHDYSGHPFQVELSRELARRGHETLHLYSPAFATGKGRLDRQADDPATFSVGPVDPDGSFDKYSAFRRPLQELRYGRRAAHRAERFDPDVVLSSNTPLLAQWVLLPRMRRAGASFVFWQQDIYSTAMAFAARRRIPLIGRHLGTLFKRIERRMLEDSDAVVVISEDFRPALRAWGVDEDKVTVVENWAPLDEIVPLPRDNAWSREHGLTDLTTILYAGSLGLKHDPSLLLHLAERFAGRPDVAVVVVSEGPGADWLAERKREREHDLAGLMLLAYQPYDRLSEVLASGDVLTAILEPQAGVFSVPSKVLSYHCAGRPILGAIPSENLAARLILREETGLLADPVDPVSLADAAETLVGSPRLRAEMGDRARAYAVSAFKIGAVADRFEHVIGRVLSHEHTH